MVINTAKSSVGFYPTVSRHDNARASSSLLIWLNETVRFSINSSWRGLTWRGSDSKQQAASRRLSSSSSLCQPNGSGHQGSMCWISIHATTLMLMCSRMTLDDTDNLWSWFCVLPQVSLWGKGFLCVFLAIFAALHPLLPQCRYLFDLCVILWGRLRIWGKIKKRLKIIRFPVFWGAQERTRTFTPCGTRTWNVRVYHSATWAFCECKVSNIFLISN